MNGLGQDARATMLLLIRMTEVQSANGANIHKSGQGGFPVILASFFDFMGILASLVFPGDAG
jgi:hypothetical protein